MQRRPGGCFYAIFMLFAVLSACGDSGDVTELRVVVDSDLPVPDELDRVRATIAPADGAQPTVHDFALDGDGAVALPLSFSIVPRGDDATREVDLTVEGMRGDDVVVERTVLTGFLAGKRLSLPILLQRSCVDRSCGADETCDQGSCVDERVDPRSLEQIAAGQDPRPARPDDGPAGDAGVDTVADAGPLDGGGGGDTTGGDGDATGGDGDDDGGTPGGGDDDPRELACAADCSCAGAARCVADAVGVDTVAVTCEARSECSVDGRSSRKLVIHCQAGASCDVDCRDSNNCMLDCAAAECRLDCTGARNCHINLCPAEPESCPDGSLVCGRDC